MKTRRQWQHPTTYWLLSALSVGLLLWGTKAGTAAPLAQDTIITLDAISTPTPVGNAPVDPAPVNLTPGPNEAGYHEQSGQQRYTVQADDTLLTIALEVGIDLTKMPCAVAPTFQVNQPLVIGDQLEIPTPELLCHQVQVGDTLAAIGERYGVAATAIYSLPWNQLQTTPFDGVTLTPGRYLRIDLQPSPLTPESTSLATDTVTDTSNFLTWMLGQPLNTSPFTALSVGGPFAEQQRRNENRAVVPANQPGAVPKNWPYGSGNFAWPLAGWLTQPYRYDHRAIDIAAPAGTVVTAADRGVVVRAGWNNQGYGRFVIIDHNIDYITLYAHLSEILVTEGQVVAQGEILGRVGSTGNSTGPHLHFEIRDFGRLTNPLELLAR